MIGLDRYSRELAGLAALLVLSGGLIHLKLWDGGYRNIDNVGVLFLVNAIASIVVAIALVVRPHWTVVLVAFGVVIGSLLGFGVSRTDWDILGFNEKGWSPTPEAAAAVVVEIAAAVLLVLLLPAAIRGDDAAAPPPPVPPPMARAPVQWQPPAPPRG